MADEGVVTPHRIGVVGCRELESVAERAVGAVGHGQFVAAVAGAEGGVEEGVEVRIEVDARRRQVVEREVGHAAIEGGSRGGPVGNDRGGGAVGLLPSEHAVGGARREIHAVETGEEGLVGEREIPHVELAHIGVDGLVARCLPVGARAHTVAEQRRPREHGAVCEVTYEVTVLGAMSRGRLDVAEVTLLTEVRRRLRRRARLFDLHGGQPVAGQVAAVPRRHSGRDGVDRECTLLVGRALARAEGVTSRTADARLVVTGRYEHRHALGITGAARTRVVVVVKTGRNTRTVEAAQTRRAGQTRRHRVGLTGTIAPLGGLSSGQTQVRLLTERHTRSALSAVTGVTGERFGVQAIGRIEACVIAVGVATDTVEGFSGPVGGHTPARQRAIPRFGSVAPATTDPRREIADESVGVERGVGAWLILSGALGRGYAAALEAGEVIGAGVTRTAGGQITAAFDIGLVDGLILRIGQVGDVSSFIGSRVRQYVGGRVASVRFRRRVRVPGGVNVVIAGMGQCDQRREKSSNPTPFHSFHSRIPGLMEQLGPILMSAARRSHGFVIEPQSPVKFAT